jgi:hypothetical protein
MVTMKSVLPVVVIGGVLVVGYIYRNQIIDFIGSVGGEISGAVEGAGGDEDGEAVGGGGGGGTTSGAGAGAGGGATPRTPKRARQKTAKQVLADAGGIGSSLPKNPTHSAVICGKVCVPEKCYLKMCHECPSGPCATAQLATVRALRAKGRLGYG